MAPKAIAQSRHEPVSVRGQDQAGLPVEIGHIVAASANLSGVVRRTPLERSERLSDRYRARIYLKREDLQTVRSYKIRGAYHRMSRLSPAARQRGVVCASAGNHAQGVALSCRLLDISGIIYMPRNTPRQKVQRVRSLGGGRVRLEFAGDTFDTAKLEAARFCEAREMAFIHPFDDADVIAGQGTVGREIFEQAAEPVDCLLVPVGGGGLIAGVAVCAGAMSPQTQVLGAEPAGAASLAAALRHGRVVALDTLDPFVDGAAVQAVGQIPFTICSERVERVACVPEGQVCTSMIDLYQNEGIIAEPAGALSVAALESLRDEIADKTVVCVVSGGNNDISRYPEVLERSLVFQGLKHYFLIEFPQRAGALRQYLDEVLGPTDDITLFEYVKKNNREFGPALVGIELADPEDLPPLLARMKAIDLRYEPVNDDALLYRFLL